MTTEDKVEETIEISNMTCVGCARTIENALRKFDRIEFSVSCDISDGFKRSVLEVNPEEWQEI